MPVIGGGNDDGVKIRSVEQFSHIASGTGFGTFKFLLFAIKDFLVGVAESHDLHPRHFLERIEVVRTFSADAGNGKAHFAAGVEGVRNGKRGTKS